MPGGTNLIEDIYGPVGKLIFSTSYPYYVNTATIPVLSSSEN